MTIEMMLHKIFQMGLDVLCIIRLDLKKTGEESYYYLQKALQKTFCNLKLYQLNICPLRLIFAKESVFYVFPTTRGFGNIY